MLSLDNSRVVLFDFDDTLCLHRNHESQPESEYRQLFKESICVIEE